MKITIQTSSLSPKSASKRLERMHAKNAWYLTHADIIEACQQAATIGLPGKILTRVAQTLADAGLTASHFSGKTQKLLAPIFGL